MFHYLQRVTHDLQNDGRVPVSGRNGEKGGCDMIKVRTEIFDSYWQGCTDVQVDEILFRQCITPLDFPSSRADATQTIFCTPMATIKMVMTDREKLSAEISKKITEQLMEFMGKQDTVMGYKVIKRG
jgi:hypothetical protein